jgi:hypothetical protein
LNVGVEYHPENGIAPWVVVLRVDGREMWFACRSKELAEQKLPAWRAFGEKLEARFKP